MIDLEEETQTVRARDRGGQREREIEVDSELKRRSAVLWLLQLHSYHWCSSACTYGVETFRLKKRTT